MAPRESLQALVARVNASAYLPDRVPTANAAVQERKVRKMATKVKLPKGREFQFRAATAQSKYPWADWLNGDLLLLEQSEGEKDEAGKVTTIRVKKDFEVDPQAMRGKVKFAGRKLYKHVDVSFRDADGNKLKDALIIRARDMTPDERLEEDQLRAEEKEINAERRAAKKATANGQPAQV